MSDPRWERVKELVAETLGLAPDRREAFLSEACAGDHELRAEVESLVRAAESAAPEFLLPPALATVAAPAGEPKILGEFELLREIGRGAMGVVYEARQKGLERSVAVKVLSIGVTTTQRQVDRFHREAIAVAKLKHPGIVPVFTTGSTQDAHYFAMEYVPGGNLGAELARQRRREPGLLPPPGSPEHLQTCARAAAEIAEALQCAHEAGVVHRDVKPQNILIGEAGAMRLVDFGLAKDESLGSLSRSGEVAGTPHYMSPEQARARRYAIDHRTDVYSLSVVLYEMLTLHRPFDGHSAEEVLTQILHKDPLPVRRRNPRVPRDLAVICATAMAKHPPDRYATAAALAADLRRFLRFESIEAQPPGLARRLRGFAFRHARALSAAALLLLGLLVGWNWSTYALASRAQAERLSALRELDAAADWSELDDGRLREARLALSEEDLESDDERALRTRLEQRFAALERAWTSEARTKIESAKRFGNPEEVGGVDDDAIIEGVLLAHRGLKIFPEARELFELVRTDTFKPRVSLRAEDSGGAALDGRAYYLELDQVTGLPRERVALGELPIESLPIRPGFYRFVIESAGQFREFTRLLYRAASPAPIVARFERAVDPVAGMVFVPGATMRNDADPEDWLCPLARRDVVVDGFYVDRHEVSNAEYRAFLGATGRKPPRVWQWLPEDARYDDRPVVDVTWFDAIAYAEWVGKRLPSHAEWELAARGSGGERFPWEVAPGEDPYRGIDLGPAELPRNVEQEFGRYLAHSLPVEAPRALGRNGLFHLLGNVCEWTENLGFDRSDDGVYSPLYEDRLLLGSWWSASANAHDLSRHKLWGTGPSFSNVQHGFRCARSGSF